MPLITFIVFSSFVVYVTWALLQGEHYHYGNYLSPLYSPELFGDSPHAVFGPWTLAVADPVHPLFAGDADPGLPAGVPHDLLLLPRRLLQGVLGRSRRLRRRRAARRATAARPSCRCIIQNVHRYALYFALLFIVLLSIDVVQGFRFNDAATGDATFGIGVGSLVLLINVVLIAGYTLGCHSFRHLVGGMLDTLSRSPASARRPTTASAASTATTPSGPGSAWCSSGSPTSTSGLLDGRHHATWRIL